MQNVFLVWTLAFLSYAFAQSTYNFKNIAASKAALTSAWVPDAEQIADTNAVRAWLTSTLTDIVENPLRDGHARVLTAHVRIRAERGDTSACPVGASFTTEAPGAYYGFEMPCDAAAERTAIEPTSFGFKNGTVVDYLTNAYSQMEGHYIMVYHAGLNDTREAVEQIEGLEGALPQLQPQQTWLEVCTVSPGVSGGAAKGCDNQFSLWVKREAGTGQHTVEMIQLTAYPEDWPGPQALILAVLIFAIVIYDFIREAMEVRRRLDYMRRIEGGHVSVWRALRYHVCTWDNFVDIFVPIWTVVWVIHAFGAASMPRPTVPPPAASSDITTSIQQWWKLATWNSASLRFEPDGSVAWHGDSPMMGSAWTHLTLGIAVSCTSYRLMHAMRWHVGVSSITNTIGFSFGALFDMLWAVLTLLLSTALGLGLVFGATVGDPRYADVTKSMGQTLLMQFGFLEYSDVASRGYGASHDGLGAGPFAFVSPTVFWVMYLLLQVIATNILIAVTGDGYAQHVEEVERQIGSDGMSFGVLVGRTFQMYFYQLSLPILYRKPQLLFRQEEDAVKWDAQTKAWPMWARQMYLAGDRRLGALIDGLRLPSGVGSVTGHTDLLPVASIGILCDTLRKDPAIRPRIEKAEEEAKGAIGDDDAEQITCDLLASAMMTHVIADGGGEATACAAIAQVLCGIRDTFDVTVYCPSDEQIRQFAEKIVLTYAREGVIQAKKGNLLRRTVTEVVRRELQTEISELKADNAELKCKMDEILAAVRGVEA